MEVAEYQKMEKIEKNHWWFVAKRNFLKYTLRRFFSSGEKKRILDVGCGTGAIIDFLQHEGYEAEGVDMSQDALSFCRQKKLCVKSGLADALEFPDNYFDAVLACDVLEHVSVHERAVVEIKRVLKPGGIFIATVPAHPFLWSYHDVALHHVRRYTKAEFNKLLSTAFVNVEVQWIHCVILLPAIFVRLFRRGVVTQKQESDVRPANSLINILMKKIYFFEIAWFAHFRSLPWGLSLLGVAQKNK